MTKTVYLLTHVDHPEDELITSIIDPNEESKPTVYLNLKQAEAELEMYLEQGLEYCIKKLVITIS